ncbi:ABC transporter permease [bacterium]|nr:MAG: ABC transporter permease [bacterium]
MIIAKIAFRNIFRHKRRSVLTGLMMTGGCFLFAISLGMVDGSYDKLIDMFTRDKTGHVQIHKKGYLEKPSIYKTLEAADPIGMRVEPVTYVQSWAPRVYTPALAFVGEKTTGVQVMGIHPEREGKTTRLSYRIDRGRFLSDKPLKEIIISDGLASILRVGLGGEVALIAQGVDGSVANELFTVVGITDAGETAYASSTCYMHINTAQEFLSMGDRIHEIAVVLEDHAKTLTTVGYLRDTLRDPRLDVEPWQVVESQFYRAMQADIKGNWYSLIVFTIIVAIGVLNTVLMVILERTREFGVLRALGTRPFQIFQLIVIETAFLAVLSIIPGVLIGMLANWILSVKGITLSTPLEWGGFYFDTITAKITLRSVVIPAVVIFGTAIVVSILPAVRAARIIPVKALRAG